MKQTNLKVLNYTPYLKVLFTKVRDKNISRKDFIFYSDCILQLLVEEALNLVPVKQKKIVTPLNEGFVGADFDAELFAVSIIRAGESMEKVVRQVCEDIKIGKILIQRNEETAEPIFYYSKLPKNISKGYVLLLDPMLGTGGSVCKAIEVLKEKGVKEDKIIFINLLSCPFGINKLQKSYPKVKIVTAFIDKKLNSKFYLVPGIGDFGDRYFGTE